MCTLVMANNGKRNVKISGYLEKKGKMKMMSSWKSHWFVLEGRLLLFYRSKDEYEALSPCKGSISLGPTCVVKPLLGTSCVFQIETRVNTIILKAKTRLEQEKWMQAILAALNQTSNTNGMLHFRYSSDELMPRQAPENKPILSRQYTLPERLKVDNRHTFCRSFETLRTNSERRPNFKISSTNDVTFTSGDDALCKGSARVHKSTDFINKNNEYYRMSAPACKEQHIKKQSLENSSTHIMIGNEEYYAVSVPTEEEREFLRTKSHERTEHIYERISGESRNSNSSKDTIIDNDTYATMLDVKRHYLVENDNSKDEITIDNDFYSRELEKLGDENGDILVDNDQYCTPDIIIEDTNLVSYHEYNLPDRDKHIYSIPNFVDNTDHNDNRISQQNEPEVNPYSICHIYPRSRTLYSTSSNVEENDLYDFPTEYAMECSKSNMKGSKGNVTKLLRRFRKMTASDEDEKIRSPVTKKSSFLKKLFRRAPEKKKMSKPVATEEVEYAQIDEEVVRKMDMTYCIDKKLLAELQMILQIKKQNLEACLEDKEMSTNCLANIKGDLNPKRQSDETLKPEVPNKPYKNKDVSYSIQENNKSKSLKTIDEILDELEEMKQHHTLTSGRIKGLITKFDQTVKKKRCRPTTSNELLYDVVLRTKENPEKSLCHNTHSSNDELSRLLCELAKVTNAPILKPGVTNSLGVTSTSKDKEFMNLLPTIERRHSEPDYDIPRPHTNLRILKDDNIDDMLPATRFFGPVMPNYERFVHTGHVDCFDPTTSISPDSLEIDTSTTNTDASMPSYSSHKYDWKGKATKFRVQKHITMQEEIFIDSLEPQDETSTIL